MQNPRDCQSAFGNVYNTVASASKNFWAFAGSSASLSAFALAFAGVPQVSRFLLWRLRGVPQVSRYLLWRLRESRKSPGICFGVCGESRRSPGICFGVCGESRKSHGICFGVCGESRKCFGEPVGRYSMLSMTFSIRVSHSFVELTLSYDHHYRLRPIVSYNHQEKKRKALRKTSSTAPSR